MTYVNQVHVLNVSGFDFVQDGVSCLNHVERYDPKENKWTKVSSMMTRRLGVAVAVLNGYLYAIGKSIRVTLCKRAFLVTRKDI